MRGGAVLCSSFSGELEKIMLFPGAHCEAIRARDTPQELCGAHLQLLSVGSRPAREPSFTPVACILARRSKLHFSPYP